MGAAIPALAAVPARPGTLNFIEGKVSVDGRELTSSAIGSADVPAGSVLRTQSGKAELLLTPGVFLRLGSNSEIRMDSAGLLDRRITVNRGRALLEAADLKKENHIQIATSGLHAAIKDEGLYRFDADQSSVSVYKGKAEVREGDEKVDVKKGKAVVASQDTSEAPLKAEKFDVNDAKKTDELYQWSNVRSKYLADASAAMAQRVVVQPSLWAGSGWYWNPWFGGYSWLPSSSAMFSPFGYGFYSPFSYYSSPVYGPVYVRPRYRTRPGYGGGPRMYSHPRPSTPMGRSSMGMGRGRR